MKRTELKRHARLGPKTFAEALAKRKASQRKRAGGGIRWKPPRRRKEELVFAPYVMWLHGEGALCIVCGTSINIQGAHVAGARGVALKHGHACDMVRLCTVRGRRLGCHEQFDQRTGRFFGWSDDQRDDVSRGWRLLHWGAFIAWVGFETARKDADPIEIAKLVACEEAILAARAKLLPGRSEAA